jgi:hypothetical protein
MASVIIGLPSTLSDWGPAVGIDDSQGCQTFLRSVSCKFTVATSSKINIAGSDKALVNTTSLSGGVRYIVN